MCRGAWLAWALWGLASAVLAVNWVQDRLLRQAGRPDLAPLGAAAAAPVLAALSAATVGAVLAARRPRHPVGWLLLGVSLSLNASGVAQAYADYGLLARPGSLPAARYAALTCLGFVLLLTPTGSLPSPRWRWWARATAAAPAVCLLAITLAPRALRPALPGGREPAGRQRPRRPAAGHLPARLRRHQPGRAGRGRVAGGAVPAGPRGRAPAAALGGPGRRPGPAGVGGGPGPVGPGRQPGAARLGRRDLLRHPAPDIGAAILRYRLYDLDRIISRTLAWTLLSVLLGLGYAAARIIEGFGARLRDQVDLDAVGGELLAVVDQTMQPTTTSLWLRPPGPPGPGPARSLSR